MTRARSSLALMGLALGHPAWADVSPEPLEALGGSNGVLVGASATACCCGAAAMVLVVALALWARRK